MTQCEISLEWALFPSLGNLGERVAFSSAFICDLVQAASLEAQKDVPPPLLVMVKTISLDWIVHADHTRLGHLCHWNNKEHFANFICFSSDHRWAGSWEKAVNNFSVSLQCWCGEDRNIYCHWPPDSADWNGEHCGCVWSGVWSSNAPTSNGANRGKTTFYPVSCFSNRHICPEKVDSRL